MIVSWAEIQTVIAETVSNVLLYGPPGTGKTRIAQTPDSYAVTLTAETPAAELRGHYVPKGSEFMWQHGPAIKAWLEGKPFVANEIDLASGDALTFMNVLLDDQAMAKLTLPTGETIRPATGFRCIATMNGQPSDLPASLLDRFAVRIQVDEPHPDAVANLALKDAVLSTLDESSDRRVSLRQAISFDSLSAQLSNPDLAARLIFGSRGADILAAATIAKLAVPESAE